MRNDPRNSVGLAGDPAPIPMVLPAPGQRLEPTTMEARIAELERRQASNARWIAALQARFEKPEGAKP